MKTKKDVLVENGYEAVCGYCFEYEKDDSYSNIVITKEEILEFLKKEPTNYYFKDGYENVLDEEIAWEELYDDWCDKNLDDNQDIKFEDWSEQMLKE